MKKIIALSLLGLLTMSGIVGISQVSVHTNNQTNISVTTSHIHETLTFDPITISSNSGFTMVSCEGATSATLGEDQPQLPVLTKTFTFPFGTHIEDISVRYHGLVLHSLDTIPCPAAIPQMLCISNVEQPNLFSGTYQKTAYPDRPFSYNTAAGLQNGQRVTFLSVHLYPARYDAISNIIQSFNEAIIHVTYKPTELMIVSDEYDLLILAPSSYTEHIETLVEHKNSIGISTFFETLENIPTVGDDIQESIKYYIKNAIESWGITDVLLVGGGLADDEQFPVRYAWIPSGSYEEKFPCDLYYADIYGVNGTFSTWDADGDGNYAEYPDDLPAMDIAPDVYVARLPCNNPFELRTVINKIITYEETNTLTNTIVQIGGDTFPGDEENVNEGEFANDQVMQVLPGYETVQLWASNGHLTKGEIIRAVTQGADFVDFSGHGSPLSWATHASNDDKVWLPKQTFYSPYSGFLYIDAVWTFNFKQYPAVVFNACSCSKFSETPDCISWVMLRKPLGGGIASFGASGIGYGSHGTHETERLFGWMEVHLFESMYTTKVLGQVWGNTIIEYATSFDLEEVDYKTLLEMALFGDPTLAIGNSVTI